MNFLKVTRLVLKSLESSNILCVCVWEVKQEGYEERLIQDWADLPSHRTNC